MHIFIIGAVFGAGLTVMYFALNQGIKHITEFTKYGSNLNS